MKDAIEDLIMRIDEQVNNDLVVLQDATDSKYILMISTHRDTLGGVRNELKKILEGK